MDGGGVLPLPPGDRLDLLLLEEKRQANSPKVRTEGKDRTALAAAGMLAPLGARAYLSGLWRMATLSNVFCGPGRPMSAGVRAKEKVQAKELRDRMEAQIAPAARELEKSWFRFPARQTAPGKSCSCPAPGGARPDNSAWQTFAVCLRRSESNTPPNH